MLEEYVTGTVKLKPKLFKRKIVGSFTAARFPATGLVVLVKPFLCCSLHTRHKQSSVYRISCYMDSKA